MTFNDKFTRISIIEACKKLCDFGLVERTWGNISARLDDEYFLITPSGIAYESLCENDLVKVRINDLSYAGNILPSSEKGVHAAIYKAKASVNFIVHTHQKAATVCSISGNDLNTADFEALGSITPCSEYALPSSVELMESVYKAVTRANDCKAALMRNHGVVCFGKNNVECFDAALALEEACADILSTIPVTLQLAAPMGDSRRDDDKFILTGCPDEGIYNICDIHTSSAVNAHREIYRTCDVKHIIHIASPAILNASSRFECLPAYVDDFAQIIGENILIADSAEDIGKKIGSRSGVLFRNAGAFCFGSSVDDCKAAASILEKNCLAALYAQTLESSPALTAEDSRYLREFYVSTYAKRKR